MFQTKSLMNTRSKKDGKEEIIQKFEEKETYGKKHKETCKKTRKRKELDEYKPYRIE